MSSTIYEAAGGRRALLELRSLATVRKSNVIVALNRIWSSPCKRNKYVKP